MSFGACEAEALALAAAEEDYDDALLVYSDALIAWTNDPTPANAIALAAAEEDLEDAELVLEDAQAAFDECQMGGSGPPPVHPIPLLLGPSEWTIQGPTEDHSVIAV